MINKKIVIWIVSGVLFTIAIVGSIFWLLNKNKKQVSQNLPTPYTAVCAQDVQQCSDGSYVSRIQPMCNFDACPDPVKTEALESLSNENDSDKPKKYEKIEWLPEPREIKDIKLLAENNSHDIEQIKVEEVGKIKTGDFSGGRLILALLTCDGPCDALIYRFVQKPNEKQLYFLSDYSSVDIFENGINGLVEGGSLNDVTFPAKNLANGFGIAELEFPQTLVAPNSEILIKESDYPINQYFDDKSNVANYGAHLDTSILKVAFNDPKYGDVYTTDPEKKGNVSKSNIFALNGFYIKAPDGTFRVYSEQISLGDVPNITWQNGEKNKSLYSYQGEYGCGSSDYASVATDVAMDDLTPIGKTGEGEIVYGFKNKKNKILVEYYNEAKELANHGEPFGDNFDANSSYDHFISLNPMFFWQDKFGRMIRFLNDDIISKGGGCGKPVIYLYPEKTQEVSVKVNPTAGMTVSDPYYDNGWNVIADKESNLKNLVDGKTYPYLFWEGKGKDVYSIPSRGFITERENLNTFFDDKLSQFGLIQKEIDDFKEFWIPRLMNENKPYYYVTFVSRQVIDKLAPLNITPKPDTIIRVLMDYQGLDERKNVQGFSIKTPERKGFTAVEWGGILK